MSDDLERLHTVIADPNQIVVLAESDGDMVAYALAQDYGPSLRRSWSVARLHDLYVYPSYRRQGIAARLHAEVVQWCEERPVRYLEWQASAAAVAFYRHLGYPPDHTGDFAKHPFFEHEFPNR